MDENPHDAMEDGRGNAPFIPPFTAASFCTESGILTSRQVAPGNGWGEPCGVGGGGGDGHKRYRAPEGRAASGLERTYLTINEEIRTSGTKTT